MYAYYQSNFEVMHKVNNIMTYTYLKYYSFLLYYNDLNRLEYERYISKIFEI